MSISEIGTCTVLSIFNRTNHCSIDWPNHLTERNFVCVFRTLWTTEKHKYCIYQMKFSLLTAFSLNTIFTERIERPRELYAHSRSDKRDHVLLIAHAIEWERVREWIITTTTATAKTDYDIDVSQYDSMRTFIQVCSQNGRASFHMRVDRSVPIPFIKSTSERDSTERLFEFDAFEVVLSPSNECCLRYPWPTEPIFFLSILYNQPNEFQMISNTERIQ